MGWYSWMRPQRSCLSAWRVCPAFVVVVSAPVGALVGAWSWWDKEMRAAGRKASQQHLPFARRQNILEGIGCQGKRTPCLQNTSGQALRAGWLLGDVVEHGGLQTVTGQVSWENDSPRIGQLHDSTDPWHMEQCFRSECFVCLDGVLSCNRTPLFTRAPVVFLNRTSNCRCWAEEGEFCQDVVVFVNVHCRHNVDEGTPSASIGTCLVMTEVVL